MIVNFPDIKVPTSFKQGRHGTFGSQAIFADRPGKYSIGNEHCENLCSNLSKMPNLDPCIFRGNLLTPQKTDWAVLKKLISETKIINGKRVFVNIEDFIQNRENSALCKKFPEFKKMFLYRAAFSDYKNNPELTVGNHTIDVLKHLVEGNQYFRKLDEKKQAALLELAIFHDIGKAGGIVTRNSLKDKDFDTQLKSQMESSKNTTSFEDYKASIERYFKENPHLDECILHNNAHPEISKEIMRKTITCKSENEADFENLLFLVLHHQTVGRAIDVRMRNNQISDENIQNDCKKLAKIISNRENLEMLRAFGISDSYAVKMKPEFLRYMNSAFTKIEKLL